MSGILNTGVYLYSEYFHRLIQTQQLKHFTMTTWIDDFKKTDVNLGILADMSGRNIPCSEKRLV